MYSDGTPIFLEDDIFQIIILTDDTSSIQVDPNITDKETNKETSSKIIEIIKENLKITVREMPEILTVSVAGVRYHINKMKEEGILQRIGSTKKGEWKIQK